MRDSLWQDIRSAVRLLRNSPGFSAVVILCLALGIGPSTATFSVINAALLHSVDVAAPDDMVVVLNHRAGRPMGGGEMDVSDSVSYPNYADLRDRTTTVDLAIAGTTEISVRAGDSTDIITCSIVSPNFFDVLGRAALHGEVFHASDNDVPGSQPVVVLGYAFWKEEFEGNPGAVGSVMRINGHDFTVIGVMPRSFTGNAPVLQPPLWVSSTMMDQIRPNVPSQLVMRNHTWLRQFGRIRPGNDLDNVKDDLARISRELATEYPESNEFTSFSVAPFSGIPVEAVEPLRQIVFLAGVVVFLLLLLSCTSTAAMQLSRATVRHREIALRMALGASRWRVFRQLLVESIFMAALAGGLALIMSLWAFEAIRYLIPASARDMVILSSSLDYRLLGFTLLVSLVAGVLFGIAPAWQMSRPDLLTPLKSQEAGGDYGSARLRNILVAAQFSMAVVLLICAGLFVKGLRRAQVLDPGFETKRMVLFDTELSLYGYSSEQSLKFVKDFRERVAKVPGVVSVSASRFPPLAESSSNTMASPINEDLSTGKPIDVSMNWIAPGYFDTTGIELVAGRDFTADDKRGAKAVIIVNETLAEHFGGGEKALGRLIGSVSGESAEIIGVAKDSKYRSLGEEGVAFAYIPIEQSPSRELAFCMRLEGDAAPMIAPISDEIRALNPDLALSRVRTMQEQTRSMLWPARLSAVLFMVFGALALLLAVVGIYGVVSYSVARRQLEIGVRMALGGQPRDLVVLLVKRGLRLVVVGAALGIGVAFAVTRFLAPLLSGLNPADAQVFVGVPLLLLAVAGIAIYLPARKATRVDPMVVLRYE